MYGGNYRNSGGFRPASARGADTPVTFTLIGANVLTFLVSFFLMKVPDNPLNQLVFASPYALARPWTVLTWPLVSDGDLFGLLFGSLWMYWIGSSLERAWGTRAFAGFLAATTVLTALTTWIGSLVLGAPAVLLGLYLASTAPTVAWCLINRRETIVIYFVVPVPAPILGWLTMGFTWYAVSRSGGHPLLGLFALSGAAAAWWWVTIGREILRNRGRGGANARFADFRRETDTPGRGNPLARWRAERERKKQDQKLQEMFRRSGYDDDRN